jgi:hypothetical protein
VQELLALLWTPEPIATRLDDSQRLLQHLGLYSSNKGMVGVTYLRGGKGRGYPENDDPGMCPQRVVRHLLSRC